MPITTLTSVTQYNEILSQGGLAVVDASASWCGPCKMVHPKYEALSNQEEYSHVHFCEFDVDNVPDLSSLLGIQAMPTFILFKDGAKKETVQGANIAQVAALVEQLAPPKILTPDTIDIKTLKRITAKLSNHPATITHPTLGFFKRFLDDFSKDEKGAGQERDNAQNQNATQDNNNIPSNDNYNDNEDDIDDKELEDTTEQDELAESKLDLELRTAFKVISQEEEAKHEPIGDDGGIDSILSDQKTGDAEKGDNDEEFDDQASQIKARAKTEYSNGRYLIALSSINSVMHKFQSSALTWAFRAQVYLALNKPRAAAKSCKLALAQNPDSGKSIRLYGQALLLSGQWLDAYKYICLSNQLDYDPDNTQTIKQLKRYVDLVKSNQAKQRVFADRKKAKEDEIELKKAQQARAEARKKAQEEYDNFEANRAKERASQQCSGGGGCGGCGPK